jgi:hypothetical protein
VQVVKACKDILCVRNMSLLLHGLLIGAQHETGVVSALDYSHEIRNQIRRPNHRDDKKRREKKIIVGGKTTRNVNGMKGGEALIVASQVHHQTSTATPNSTILQQRKVFTNMRQRTVQNGYTPEVVGEHNVV